MTTIHIHYLPLDHIISFHYAYSLHLSYFLSFFSSFISKNRDFSLFTLFSSSKLAHTPLLFIFISTPFSILFLFQYTSQTLSPHMIGQRPPYSRGNTQRFLWTQVPRLISFLPVKNLSPLHSTNFSPVISLNPQSTPTLALSSMIQKGILRFFISFNFLFPTHSYIRTTQDVCSQQHLQGIFRFHQGHR